MPDTENFTYSSIQETLTDKALSKQEKIKILQRKLEDEQAMQRAATESNMVEDPDQGSRMQDLELALNSLRSEQIS